MSLSSRLSLTIAILAVLGTAARGPGEPPADPAAAREERRLRLLNLHTGERVDVVFRRGERYDEAALAELEHFLRDFRTGGERTFDPRVFDLLADVAAAVGRPQAELHVISGYRSPETNEMLRRRTTGVASRSLHMQAQAIDVRLPGVDTARLRDAALALARGGVGYYADSDFVHLDVGRVRRW